MSLTAGASSVAVEYYRTDAIDIWDLLWGLVISAITWFVGFAVYLGVSAYEHYLVPGGAAYIKRQPQPNGDSASSSSPVSQPAALVQQLEPNRPQSSTSAE